MTALKGDELYAKMAGHAQRYASAMEAHDLGRALAAREDAAKLLAANFANVVRALELWAFPASHGCEPENYDEQPRQGLGEITAPLDRKLTELS